MGAAKVVEPECRVVVAGVVFDERELSPAHGASEPGWGGGMQLRGCERGGGADEKIPTGVMHSSWHYGTNVENLWLG